MRIVAGALRGRALVAPKGHSTRPTADRTRQALFNVLEHAPWAPGLAGLRVLDLFAGSGALGLESLSRGAAFALFVDSDPAARAAVTAHVEAFRLSAVAQVVALDATRLPPCAQAPFDLAFLDPPYAKGLVPPALAALTAGGWLAPQALVVVERAADEADLAAPGYDRLDTRRWGAARVDFLSVNAARTAALCPPA